MATASVRPEPPLVVIVGPTASGKTGLAIRLALEFDGEVISADSRAIYKGLDIGTAKPTLEERSGVKHWGVDLVEPGERFTAADFKKYADVAIADIRKRGKVPILVGGTGLYVDAVIYDYSFAAPSPQNERQKFEKYSIEELHKYCHKNNIILPENKHNKRYVVNNIIRRNTVFSRRKNPINNTCIVGITTDKDILKQRIATRADSIFSPAMYEEAERAGSLYGWDCEAMTGNIYPLIRQYLEGEMNLDEAKVTFKILDWRLAKRQLTWLRRSEHIHWTSLDEAYTYIARLMAR